jgi:hypothetical protein
MYPSLRWRNARYNLSVSIWFKTWPALLPVLLCFVRPSCSSTVPSCPCQSVDSGHHRRRCPRSSEHRAPGAVDAPRWDLCDAAHEGSRSRTVDTGARDQALQQWAVVDTESCWVGPGPRAAPVSLGWEQPCQHDICNGEELFFTTAPKVCRVVSWRRARRDTKAHWGDEA